MVKPERYKRNETALKILGANVRKYRKAKGLTIMQLADMLEVDYSHMSKIERALVNTGVTSIFDIAAALDIQAFQLLEP